MKVANAIMQFNVLPHHHPRWPPTQQQQQQQQQQQATSCPPLPQDVRLTDQTNIQQRIYGANSVYVCQRRTVCDALAACNELCWPAMASCSACMHPNCSCHRLAASLCTT
jgi:hypothetical protein